MTTMVTEIYDALLSAGADENKAKKASEVMVEHFMPRDNNNYITKQDLSDAVQIIRKDIGSNNTDLAVLKAKSEIFEKMMWGIIASMIALVLKAYFLS